MKLSGINPWIFVGIAFLFAAERLFPLRRVTRALPPRIFVNAVISTVALGTAFLLVRPAVHLALDWTAQAYWGLLYWLKVPGPLTTLVSFLLLDLSFYYWHRLNHETSFLWRFHNVHHFDPDLDVTTAFRFHFGEVALSSVFRAVQVALIGVSLSDFLLFELVFQLATYFHHSNVRLPLKAENALQWVFVTPRMHWVHHSQLKQETNSNYSVIFSCWDRLHRTLTGFHAKLEPCIGVPGYREPGDNTVGFALKAPFQPQRSYWD